MDFALYLFFGVLYFFVIELGGGSEDLGNVTAAGGICYVLAAIVGGRLSDRVPRLVLARIGCVVFVCLVAAVSLCRSIPPIILLFMPMGLSMGIFWPPVQARLADMAGPGRLASVTGRFNICWSVGKGLGFLAAGSLVEIFGGLGTMGALLATFYLAAAAGLAPYLLLSGDGAPPPEEEAQQPERDRPSGPHLKLAWICNFAIFGAGASLVTHHPKWITEIGLREIHADVFLAAVFLSQTVGFFLWSAYTRWHYRLGEFWITQVIFGGAVVAVPFLGSFEATLLLALPIGLGLGLAYQASIFYSLDVSEGRGRNSGLHEGILGSGNFLLPVIGGWVAGTSLGVTAPYLVAGFAVCLGLFLQAAVSRLSSAPT